jgi:hypothetical protein
VVGANESGKSHLLSAIEKGLTGEGLSRNDFCRYSDFYTVEAGKWRWPDFAFEWTDLSAQEEDSIQKACGTSSANISRFVLFRKNRTRLTVYLPDGQRGYACYPINEDHQNLVETCLPSPLRINSNVALPDSVPIRWLADIGEEDTPAPFEQMSRKRRFGFFENLAKVFNHSDWFKDSQTVKQQADSIASTMNTVISASEASDESAEKGISQEVRLAQKLIFDVAGIDRAAIADLYRALKTGDDGHANGLVQRINRHLAARLNLPKWWTQDRDFQLRLSPRDHDLVFTICDRTGTEYSFNERSDGLKYFLSYYVQYRAHKPSERNSEILLMDEPDAYLSSRAQQDLLKIFRAFSEPDTEKPPIQVMFVTHSPFLIDKNHGERIRVLEKGKGDEGTRVVRDVSRNHYEPLRSAFGAFVGETAFIGTCNLVVEGGADQILLAGIAAFLQSRGVPASETLDLTGC